MVGGVTHYPGLETAFATPGYTPTGVWLGVVARSSPQAPPFPLLYSMVYARISAGRIASPLNV